jgi:hypothetical protein
MVPYIGKSFDRSTGPRKELPVMKKIVLIVFLVFATNIGCSGVATSVELTTESIEMFDTAYKYLVVLEGTEEYPVRFLYSDVAAHLHAYSVKDGRTEMIWETATMGSAVTSLNVTDLGVDGVKEVIVSTARGRIIVFDSVTFERLGENYLEPFETISCMAIENIDNDPQKELIFIGDGQLNIYDGESTALEWRSPDPYDAQEILVANVDDDPQPEIILNTGTIIDSRFYTVEPSNVASGSFGRRIRLLDLNGDGYPEIIGEMPGFALRIYDVYAQREIW